MDIDSDDSELLASLESEDPEDVRRGLDLIGKGERYHLQTVVESFLQHPNLLVRSGAVKALGFYWQLPEFRSDALALFNVATDEQVKCTALSAYAMYGFNKRDQSILDFLFGVLTDPGELPYVRQKAYMSLLRVGAIPVPDWPNIHLDDIDKDVDWALVERILRDPRNVSGGHS